MCMADGGWDGPDHSAAAKIKARKVHRCGECHREIARGETYERAVTFYDGTASTYKTCSHCLVMADWLSENCDGYIFGSVIEDFGEHATEYNREDIGALAAMARRDWKNTEGVLFAIPEKPRPVRLGDAHV